MDAEPHESADDLLTHCTWCGTPIAHNTVPAHLANIFCSRHCELEGNFWLLQEMCEIEINHLSWPDSSRDSL
jgi:recombinational DNA repair protein (RecF pathway)